MRKLLCIASMAWLLHSSAVVQAQTTFPVNGVADNREGAYAFTNATIVKDGQTTFTNAILVIRDGKIVAAGNNISIPKDAVIIDCRDKFIYPSFIDIYSDYGIAVPQRLPGGGEVEHHREDPRAGRGGEDAEGGGADRHSPLPV